jgi:hypothetical protein
VPAPVADPDPAAAHGGLPAERDQYPAGEPGWDPVDAVAARDAPAADPPPAPVADAPASPLADPLADPPADRLPDPPADPVADAPADPPAVAVL